MVMPWEPQAPPPSGRCAGDAEAEGSKVTPHPEPLKERKVTSDQTEQCHSTNVACFAFNAYKTGHLNST